VKGFFAQRPPREAFQSRRQAKRWHSTTNPGPVPEALRMTVVDTGTVHVFRIPDRLKHLIALKGRASQ
jgi:hypothetical protein